IVALGAPSDNAGKMGIGGPGPGGGAAGGGAGDGQGGDVNALSEAANVDTVPLDMLSMPDDQEQMQPPEVGDVVNYQVTGKVTAIEGNYAKIERQSINGQEMPDSDDDEDNENENPQDANGDGGGGGGEAGSLRDEAAGIGMLS
ncbi:MAG: hypothetical protein ACRED1_08560, partial [Limisphaerales bacterium]